MSKKIILIHNIVNPTRTHFFNKLNEKFLSEWYNFKIIFSSENESIRKWDIKKEISTFEFDYEILNSKTIHSKSKTDHHFFHINIWFTDILRKENADIIIHAWWAWLSAWQSCLWCKKNNKKYILWNESTKYEDSWRRTLTKPIVKWLVNNSTEYISFWTRSKEYLEILWAESYKIHEFYNTIDIDFFIKQWEQLIIRKNEFKKKYWLQTNNVLLYVWRLEKGKWVYEMLEWFWEFQKNNNDITLLIVWWWNEENYMKQVIKDKWYKNIIFAWYIQKNNISELFVISDIFTLPSKQEVWWLVINEAMCFWLPILTAHKVWASVDLVEEWKNGYIMKENNKEEFKKWLDFIINNDLINNNVSLEKIKDFSIDKILDKLKI
jgi:glycosyltransferase involved in cell wall biosynthesis